MNMASPIVYHPVPYDDCTVLCTSLILWFTSMGFFFFFQVHLTIEWIAGDSTTVPPNFDARFVRLTVFTPTEWASTAKFHQLFIDYPTWTRKEGVGTWGYKHCTYISDRCVLVLCSTLLPGCLVFRTDVLQMRLHAIWYAETIFTEYSWGRFPWSRTRLTEVFPLQWSCLPTVQFQNVMVIRRKVEGVSFHSFSKNET